MGFSREQIQQWKNNAAISAGKPVDELAILKKENKHRNKKIAVDGLKFDSKKEATRWGMLVLKQKHGVIKDLERQVVFKLEVDGNLVCKYIADHVYIENGVKVVEDVKSEWTRKLPYYRIKKKLMKNCLGIEIREV